MHVRLRTYLRTTVRRSELVLAKVLCSGWGEDGSNNPVDEGSALDCLLRLLRSATLATVGPPAQQTG